TNLQENAAIGMARMVMVRKMQISTILMDNGKSRSELFSCILLFQNFVCLLAKVQRNISLHLSMILLDIIESILQRLKNHQEKEMKRVRQHLPTRLNQMGFLMYMLTPYTPEPILVYLPSSYIEQHIEGNNMRQRTKKPLVMTLLFILWMIHQKPLQRHMHH
ncbi:hypothetical protein ACJX0J_031149, partial [Zea mays]